MVGLTALLAPGGLGVTGRITVSYVIGWGQFPCRLKDDKKRHQFLARLDLFTTFGVGDEVRAWSLFMIGGTPKRNIFVAKYFNAQP